MLVITFVMCYTICRYHGAQEGDGEATITAREQQKQTAYAVLKFTEALSDR